MNRPRRCGDRAAAVIFGLLFLASSLHAHVVSISTGELRVDGPTAVFDLSIPVYEVAQLAHPETELLAHFRFGDGHLAQSTCHVGSGAEEGFYVCHAEYEFPTLHPDPLKVECTLFQATAPNHVHLLTAIQGSNTDQEVFDRRFTAIEVHFRPPSRAQAMAREAVSGALRAVETASGMLFLIALGLAARTGKEALVFGLAFVAAECAARRLGPLLPLALSARFLEAVVGLTVAYLAVEILLLPHGRSRWPVVAILGLCHGLSFAGFPPTYLMGALSAQILIFAMLAVATIRMPLLWKRPAAALLLAAGVAWFGTRLIQAS